MNYKGFDVVGNVKYNEPVTIGSWRVSEPNEVSGRFVPEFVVPLRWLRSKSINLVWISPDIWYETAEIAAEEAKGYAREALLRYKLENTHTVMAGHVGG